MIMVAVPSLQAASPDGRIEQSIRDSYNFRTYLGGDEVTVKSVNGAVTLTGLVAQNYDKTLAGETAAGISGVTSVNNDLKVQYETPAERSDGWITTKVKGTLAFHKNVKAGSTEVATEGGRVTLKGKADSMAQKELTTEYAKDVEGVVSVDNQMTVTGAKARETLGAKVDDASITAQIKTSLLFHRSTHAVATKVKTRRGVVILRGEARSAAEKGLVGKLAEDTQGVKRVENRMTVKQS
jgi:osmotically-inducible protein OsmY